MNQLYVIKLWIITEAAYDIYLSYDSEENGGKIENLFDK